MAVFGILSLVMVILGGFLLAVTALFAYVVLRRRPQPPRGFDVVPDNAVQKAKEPSAL